MTRANKTTQSLPSNFMEKCAAHYTEAVAKHPTFAKYLFRASSIPAAKETLKSVKALLTEERKNKAVKAEDLLSCELAKAVVEYGKYENEKAIDGLYDALVVIMRMIKEIEED